MAERLITDIGGLSAEAVPREEVPQLFWEKQMIAMFNVLWSKGVFNLDEFRRMVEQTPPEEYKKSTFYGRRLDGMADLLIEKDIIQRENLEARTKDILAKGTRDHVR
jgi:nitrile hydratase